MARLRIESIEQDVKSYHREGAVLVFSRKLGDLNTVVLPQGYQLVSVNYPAQVLQQPDGRVAISFRKEAPNETPLVMRARPSRVIQKKLFESTLEWRLGERASSDRDVVYALQPPESHSFDYSHDATDSEAGVGVHLDPVSSGTTVINPWARNLDTGELLLGEVVTRKEHTRPIPGPPSDIYPGLHEVHYFYPKLQPGKTIRLRIFGTYTDSTHYGLIDNELVWNRLLGGPAAIILPPGWLLTNSSIPAIVRELPDGRIRLDLNSPGPDAVTVFVTAHKK